MTSETYHESLDKLSAHTQDLHRAIVSLMEELEAVDWYQQRVDAAEDAELREILEHNRDEEKEHAAMLIEWLRRNDDHFAKQIATYIGVEGSILEAEEEAEG
jgi:ferritin-like protein